MKAAVVPAVNGTWQIRDVPRPEPGPTQVLIKVGASGLCYSDVHQTRNWPWPGDFPRILGHEPVGEVVAVGAAVRTRAVGDRVGAPTLQSSCGRCEWCLRGEPLFCQRWVGISFALPGGHADYMLAEASATVPLPAALSYEQAAPLFCAGYTVWSGLRSAVPRPGERVAVLGIGGLGHLAVQYAKAAGFETTAITRSPDKVDLARSLGADTVVADGDALRRAGGADVILAASNSYAATGAALAGLRPDGRVVLMGISDEPLVVTSDLIFKRQRIIGSQQNGPEYLYEALALAAAGKVRVYTESFPLSEAAHAYRRVANGDVHFRAVLVP